MLFIATTKTIYNDEYHNHHDHNDNHPRQTKIAKHRLYQITNCKITVELSFIALGQARK